MIIDLCRLADGKDGKAAAKQEADLKKKINEKTQECKLARRKLQEHNKKAREYDTKQTERFENYNRNWGVIKRSPHRNYGGQADQLAAYAKYTELQLEGQTLKQNKV